MVGKLKRVVLLCAVFGLVIGMGARAEAQPIPASEIVFQGKAEVLWNSSEIIVSGGAADATCTSALPCTGVFADLTPGFYSAAFQDFFYGTGITDPGPAVVGLWDFSALGQNWSFDLIGAWSTSLHVVGHIDIAGRGYLHVPALAPILADFFLSSTGYQNLPPPGSITGTVYPFLALNIVPVGGNNDSTVPDGGSTAALLGSILIGFGIVRRRFFQA